MKNIKILVPASLSFSAGIREMAQEAGGTLGFSKKQQNMLKLVVDEIFMNAIRYGSDEDSHIFLEAVIDNDNKQLIVAIEDEGKGKEKVSADDLKKILENEKKNTSLHKGHGRGLAQITSELVQAFDIQDKESGGLRIEFMMKKQDEETKAAHTPLKKQEKVLGEKILKFSGDIDLNNLEQVSEPVEEILKKYYNTSFRLIFDFKNLQYCNSTFLGLLAQWQSTLEEWGGEAVIQEPSQEIFEILDLVGLNNLFIITDIQKENTEEKHEETADTSSFKSID